MKVTVQKQYKNRQTIVDAMKNARSNENQNSITKLLATTANPRAGSSNIGSKEKPKPSRTTHSFNVDLPINKYQSSTFILAKKATPQKRPCSSPFLKSARKNVQADMI